MDDEETPIQSSHARETPLDIATVCSGIRFFLMAGPGSGLMPFFHTTCCGTIGSSPALAIDRVLTPPPPDRRGDRGGRCDRGNCSICRRRRQLRRKGGSRWAVPDLFTELPPGRDVGSGIGLARNDGGHREAAFSPRQVAPRPRRWRRDRIGGERWWPSQRPFRRPESRDRMAVIGASLGTVADPGGRLLHQLPQLFAIDSDVVAGRGLLVVIPSNRSGWLQAISASLEQIAECTDTVICVVPSRGWRSKK
jgi:hypothetical protein